MEESKLKEARLKAGLRQEDLAKKVEVSLAAIRKYEQDPETLKTAAFKTVIEICNILNIDPLRITDKISTSTKELLMIGALEETPKDEWSIADEICYKELGEWPTRYTEKAKSLISPLPHGWIKNVRFESYHNVIEYEDGYEEWNSIGD